MRANNMNTEDREFLARCQCFCNKIGSYATLLELNDGQLEAFKNDCKVMTFALDNTGLFQSFAASFARCQISNLRISFSHLAQCCRNSDKYTIAIGYELGIEVPVYAFTYN